MLRVKGECGAREMHLMTVDLKIGKSFGCKFQKFMLNNQVIRFLFIKVSDDSI